MLFSVCLKDRKPTGTTRTIEPTLPALKRFSPWCAAGLLPPPEASPSPPTLLHPVEIPPLDKTLLVYSSSQCRVQRHYNGGLKSVIVGVFTPQKLASATDQPSVVVIIVVLRAGLPAHHFPYLMPHQSFDPIHSAHPPVIVLSCACLSTETVGGIGLVDSLYLCSTIMVPCQ